MCLNVFVIMCVAVCVRAFACVCGCASRCKFSLYQTSDKYLINNLDEFDIHVIINSNHCWHPTQLRYRAKLLGNVLNNDLEIIATCLL